MLPTSCFPARFKFWPSGDTWFVGDETHEALHVKLVGPRAAYDIVTDKNQPIMQAIQKAIAEQRE
jgi:hypothetical protein